MSWFKSLKNNYKVKWNDWFLNGTKFLTKYGNLAGPGYENMSVWINDCWENLDLKKVKDSFLYCGITSNDLNDYHSQLRDLVLSATLPPNVTIDIRNEEDDENFYGVFNTDESIDDDDDENDSDYKEEEESEEEFESDEEDDGQSIFSDDNSLMSDDLPNISLNEAENSIFLASEIELSNISKKSPASQSKPSSSKITVSKKSSAPSTPSQSKPSSSKNKIPSQTSIAKLSDSKSTDMKRFEGKENYFPLQASKLCYSCEKSYIDSKEKDHWVGCEQSGCQNWCCRHCWPKSFDITDDYFCRSHS